MIVNQCVRCEKPFVPGDAVVEIKNVRYVGNHFLTLDFLISYIHEKCLRIGYNPDDDS